MNRAVVPDCQLVVIARDDDATFGILHSRFHELWALRLGTSLEDRPRYTPSTTFETFPFPEGLTPNLPPSAYTNPHAPAIADAARNLTTLRDHWLNPPELINVVPEVVPGFPDRLLPKDSAAAAELKKRTLTNLYNAKPAWLRRRRNTFAAPTRVLRVSPNLNPLACLEQETSPIDRGPITAQRICRTPVLC